jgi:hypothetical protein
MGIHMDRGNTDTARRNTAMNTGTRTPTALIALPKKDAPAT